MCGLVQRSIRVVRFHTQLLLVRVNIANYVLLRSIVVLNVDICYSCHV